MTKLKVLIIMGALLLTALGVCWVKNLEAQRNALGIELEQAEQVNQAWAANVAKMSAASLQVAVNTTQAGQKMQTLREELNNVKNRHLAGVPAGHIVLADQLNRLFAQ